MPVLADASTALIGGAGHTFIIDGYKSTRRKITTKYRWMQYDYQTGQHYQTEQFISEVSYLSPVIDHIYMNWGETDLSLNDIAFSPSGDWNLNNQYLLNYKRNMTYGFSLSQ